ncbi:DNA/RNA polymerase [Microstroma glucosiphilum]|uniref:DNA polymerase kappa n=1 Tax=Pseudomicrostroma glucosiphilum TaxID=1684307 RepID=A0A316U8F5_9BASI|nr:DNA/RNA polymerase [Pseudomicrostroma glucosiphilum]PWN21489.1 DNA/RNA polymerase [Pseudomicrostroma glucosiphilum]
MAAFVRDRDLEHLDQTTDPTAAEGPAAAAAASSSSSSRLAPVPPANTGRGHSSSVSPQKKQSRYVDATNVKANESLLKRMGGPSAAKAGLTKDQDEINRIIYEASKGSKYFENERKSDERITKKVEAMLEKMHERLQAVPEGSPEWTSIEKKAEAMRNRVETQRVLSQYIVHVDCDMFYAAVELKRDPSLKGKAFGVGKGVLVTASYEARRFGVRSGMASYIAMKLCPHLITVPNDMQSYVAASRQIMDILHRFDENLAQASLDEAYLDVTAFCRLNKMDVSDAVAQLRQEVRDETGLTVSVGVAPNKMLAKIGSDKNKPDGQYILDFTREASIEFMDQLPVRKVPGIGRVTERMLQSLGVETCGDVWRLRVKIALVLGDEHLQWLLRYYLGIASSVVEPGKREERKSVGREHTFQPTSDPEKLFELLRESAETVEDDLKRLDFVGRKVTLICKYDNFQRFTRDQTQTKYVSTADDIYRVVRSLLEYELKVQPGLSLRLIGARVGTLMDVRKPADGGPLKRFFDKGASGEGSGPVSPKKRRIRRDAGHPDSVTARDGMSGAEADMDLEGDAEDEESRQIRLAIAASLEDMEQSRLDDDRNDDEQGSARPSVDEQEWELPPPAERSAATFANALHRSSAEVVRPAHKARLKGDDGEIREAMRTHEETAAAAAAADKKAREPPRASWFVKRRSPAGGSASPAPGEGEAGGVGESNTAINGSGSSSTGATEPLVCPICSQPVEVRFGSTLAGRNAQLNKHIDACLQGATTTTDLDSASSSNHSNNKSKSKSKTNSDTSASASKPARQQHSNTSKGKAAGDKKDGNSGGPKGKNKSALERFLGR